jgi:serine/threonine-protein kinase ATR
MYTDPRLGRQVARLHPMLLPDQPAQRPAKRLRPSLESKTLPQVIEMLNDLIPVRSFSGEMVVLEDEVL